MSDPIIIHVSIHILIARHVFKCGMSWNSQGLCSVASGYVVSTIAGLHALYMGSIVRFPPVSYAFNALRARKVQIVTKYVE